MDIERDFSLCEVALEERKEKLKKEAKLLDRLRVYKEQIEILQESGSKAVLQIVRCDGVVVEEYQCGYVGDLAELYLHKSGDEIEKILFPDSLRFKSTEENA